MEIKITIEDNGEVVAQRSAYSFESAEENLGKLERQFKTQAICTKCGDFILGAENSLCQRCV